MSGGIASGPIAGAPITGGSSAPTAIVYEEDLGDSAAAAEAAADEILPALRAGLTASDATAADVLATLRERVTAASSFDCAGRFAGDLSAGGTFTDAVAAAWAMLLADTGDADDGADATTRKLAVLAESLQALAAVDGRMTALAAVAVAAALEDMAAPGWSVDALDQAALADAAQSTMRAMLAVLDAATVAGEAVGTFRMLALVDETLTVADTPHGLLRALESLADGAAIYCTLRIGSDDYAGWVVNTELRAATEYRNVPFDSFAMLNGRTYAAGDGGIFELAGNTDNGEPIDAWFRPFLTDFGASKMKRVSDIWLGTSAKGLLVKVHTKDPVTGNITEDIYPVERNHGAGNDKGRVKVGRGLSSHWWTLTVANVAGADFSIDGIEWKPLVLDRRQ